MKNKGQEIYNWAKKIFYYNRSITGEGTVKTIKFIQKKLPNLKLKNFKSGKKVFDWIIPDEWNVKEAYIADLEGKKLIDFRLNNLHLMGYSTPINKKIKFKDLIKKLHTIKKMPNAIPYRYSYYSKDWGFCIQYNKLKLFKNKYYKVFIDSSFKKGNLPYGELLINGISKKEILLSTYICHPSMGNNEVSGPVLLTALAQYLRNKKNLYYSYRIIFIPETIGSIAYIHKNIKILKKNVVAGYVVTCVGDNKEFSYLETQEKNTLSNKIAQTAFKLKNIKFKKYSFLQRGSDERQFNSPGVELNIGSIMRTKYGEYKEYHTSLDNLNFISAKGFQGSYDIYKQVIDLFEINRIYKNTKVCEPFFTKYKLRNSTDGTYNSKISSDINISDVCAYLDGKRDLIDLSDILSLDIYYINEMISLLKSKKIIKMVL
tara:strand:- start:650 stop:1939 length:1290 start_codon:yes stop_codon:yes gene_type:complete